MFKSFYKQTTIDALESGARATLKKFVDYMPLDEHGYGQFWNCHNNTVESCPAIGIQADGTVVALFDSICSVNPLRINSSKPTPVMLLTGSVGGTFIPDHNFSPTIDWEKSVERYNETLFIKRKMIVAIHVFESPVAPIKEICAKGDIFIIPNPIVTCESFFPRAQARVKEWLNGLYSMNNIMDTDGIEKELLLETWIISEDLATENLADHGFEVMIDGERRFFGIPYRHLPVKLFSSVEEGDIVHVTIPITNRETKFVEVLLHLNLHVNQLGHRYGNFGRFEKLLDRLINSYVKNH
jgi:hypothetical protein